MPIRTPEAPDRLVVRELSVSILRSLATQCDVLNLDMISLLIFTGVWTANTEHLTDGSRFAKMTDLPPDHFRGPIRVGELASRLRMPLDLVTERAAQLEAMALVQSDERGIWAPTGVFVRAEVLRAFGALVGDAEMLAQTLRARGLPSAA